MVNIIFLTPIQPGSGNVSTALRIINGLKLYFDNIYLEDANSYKTYTQLKNTTKFASDIDIIICVHAYHSGRLFYNDNPEQSIVLQPPLITIFGGTDVHAPHDDWLKVIENTINISKYLICFSDELKHIVLRTYPQCANKCVIIPQGVIVNPSKEFYLKHQTNKKIISWTGSIRKIKDPLFIKSLLDKVYEIDQDIMFTFAGYSLDDTLVENLKQLEMKHSNIIYLNGLSSNDSQAIISKSWAFINTSINEGMSLAILEAMKLKVPCIVRKNFGNCSLIKHEFNGLIFENENEFIENILYLRNDEITRQNIISNAFQYVNEKHSIENETNLYYNCVMNVLNKSNG